MLREVKVERSPFRSRSRLGEVPVPVFVVAALAALYGWAVFLSTFSHPGSIGLNYNTPGSDWMVLYEAARLASVGKLSMTADGAAFTAHLNATFADRLTEPLYFRPWVYPPSFLLVLVPFTPLGFSGAYAAFQASSAALLAMALAYRPDRPLAWRWIALAALLSPAASINVVDGQCGFLVAALLVGVFRTAGPRPVVAGVLLGLLTFKPQFGLLAPVALLAMGRWKTLASAVATVLLLVAVSAAVFGAQAWADWGRQTLEGYAGGDPKWVLYGRIWGSSVYACAVLLGLSAKLASLAQTLAVLGSAAATFVVYRSRRSPDVKLAILLTATLIAAPHSAGYDGVLLVIACGLWLSAMEPARPFWAWLLALSLWVSPMIGPPVLVPVGRLLPLLLAGFVVIVLRNSARPAQPAAVVPAFGGQA